MMSLNYFEKLVVNDINRVALWGARHRRRVGESHAIGGRAADEFVEVRSCVVLVVCGRIYLTYFDRRQPTSSS